MGGGAQQALRRRSSGGPLLWWPLLALVATGAARAPPDDCFLPCVVGRCRAAFPRWWYNATSQVCQEFIFGGCKGNPNNFLSEKECLQACATGGDEEEIVGSPTTSKGGAESHTTKAPSTSSPHQQPAEETVHIQDDCAAPPVTGLCRASFPRWFFDLETRTCKMFIYGGCGGNRNNYVLEEDCLNQCARGRERPREPEEDPGAHGHLFPDPVVHSTRAVILAVLLALLLASLVMVLFKICRKTRELSLGTVWNTQDDKEFLMSNGHAL